MAESTGKRRPVEKDTTTRSPFPANPVVYTLHEWRLSPGASVILWSVKLCGCMVFAVSLTLVSGTVAANPGFPTRVGVDSDGYKGK